MIKSSAWVWVIAVSVSCAAAPPPKADTAADDAAKQELVTENRQLRERVTELESGMQTMERTSTADSEAVAQARDELAKREAEIREQQERERKRKRDAEGDVMRSVPIDGGVIDGRADALVTIVVGTEAACPYCWRAEKTLDDLRKQYGRDLRIVYKQRIVHPATATTPARAVCAADKQRKGLKMWRAIGKQYEAHRAMKFKRADMVELAKGIRLNTKRLERDMDGVCAAAIEAQTKEMAGVGVQGTPSFFVNGYKIRGAQSIDVFTKLVDRELAKAREMVKSGVRRRDVYKAVVALGRK